MKLLFKYRFFLLTVMAAAAITSAIFSMKTPFRYETTALISPPKVLQIALDTPDNIRAKIVSTRHPGIAQDLGIDLSNVRFKTSIPYNSTFVTAVTVHPDKDLGGRMLKKLASELALVYQPLMDQKAAQLDVSLSSITATIVAKMHGTAMLEKQIEVLRLVEKDLAGVRTETIANNKKLTDGREVLLKSASSASSSASDGMALLLYSSTLQQSIAYQSEIATQMGSLRAQQQNLLQSISQTQCDIATLQGEKHLLEIARASLKNVDFIEPPTVYPLKTSLPLNTLIGALSGLLLGLTAIFAFETYYKLKTSSESR